MQQKVVRAILSYQWRAYWRRVRRAGNISTNNVGLLVIVGGLALIRFFQQLPILKTQLAQGTTTKYEVFLTIVFWVWLLPVMGESRLSINTRTLLHMPLSYFELYSIRAGSVLMSPIVWTITVCVLILSYFVSSARNGVLAVVSLWTFLLIGFFTSLMVNHLLSHSAARKVLLLVLLVASVVFGLSWFTTSTRLSSSVFLPHHLAANVATSTSPVRPLAVLFGLFIVAVLASFFSFKMSLYVAESKRSRGFSSFVALPGRFGGLIKKDIRYAFRLLDVYLVVPVLIVMDIYLVVNPEPTASVVWASTIAILFPMMSLAFNSFGLDSPLGMDRYQLLPLSARELLITKNLAFGLIALLLFSLVGPLVVWKLGWVVTGVALLQLLLGLLAYFSFGNWMSIKQPFRMQFYRFASGGSPVDAVMGLLFGSLPCAITIYWLVQHGYKALWRVALMILIYAVIYVLSLNRAAQLLRSRTEFIRTALT
jgi:hypothetical protein